MKKIAILFVVAVLLPSLVLAWMAVRSLRDQEYALERQQSLLYQGVADSVAARLTGILEAQQRDFGRVVESLIGDGRPLDIVHGFDERLRPQWPLAAVGFCVSLTGEIFSPSPLAGAEARRFRLENDLFLSNKALRCEQCDRTIGGTEEFSVRRARLAFSGDVADRVFVYVQPDLAQSSGTS